MTADPATRLRLGSLCTGYGGLDLGAELALGPVRHTWHAELDPDASKVLAAHWPDVPNLGDLTAVDWPSVGPVDVLTAGFPCQDVSHAGRRAGLKPGTRTGLWSHIAYAINVLRPPLVLLENVEGLLSGRTDSDVEPCPWCLGDTPPDLVVRALGAVLADLATLGFDAEWATVPASDVGAPHRRKRVFIAAWPAADTHSGRLGAAVNQVLPGESDPDRGGAPGPGLTLLPTPAARLGDRWGMPSVETAADRMDSGRRNLEDAVALLPTPTSRDAARGAGWGDQPGRPLSETIHRLLPTPRATDGTKGGPNQRGSSGDLMLPSAVVQLLPTPTAVHWGRNVTAERRDPKPDTNTNGWTLADVAHAERWGQYAPAIARWEHTTGRPAPDPTEPGRNGKPRLSPHFVQWLMGLPAGWVTDHLPRNPALRVLGNGVVPAQAAAAITDLLRTIHRTDNPAA